jgi:CAAX protease family protein
VKAKTIVMRITPKIELLIILIIGFGFPIYTSTYSSLMLSTEPNQSWLYKFTSNDFYYTILYEAIALLIIICFLKLRGWSLNDFNLGFTYRLIFVALLLVFISNVLKIIIYTIAELFIIETDISTKHIQYNLDANWISILLILIINSLYEEIILIGYLFKRLEKYNPIIIIGLSLLIRESYHSYQGLQGMLLIIPLGLVYGYYYYKYKKLWPIVLGHAFNNLLVFVSMHYSF